MSGRPLFKEKKKKKLFKLRRREKRPDSTWVGKEKRPPVPRQSSFGRSGASSCKGDSQTARHLYRGRHPRVTRRSAAPGLIANRTKGTERRTILHCELALAGERCQAMEQKGKKINSGPSSTLKVPEEDSEVFSSERWAVRESLIRKGKGVWLRDSLSGRLLQFLKHDCSREKGKRGNRTFFENGRGVIKERR